MDFNDARGVATAVLDRIVAAGPVWYLAVPAAAAVLVVLAVLLRRWARTRTAARMVTTLATVLGLGWSAQGMWDAAVHSYDVPAQIASILFIVFEAMLISQMLKAHQYRADLPRRARFVRAVWLIAAVMALVVAFGEGLAQAPLRLAVPLLVAYSWWLDLTADDDPDAKPATSWRWTPRELGLRAGLLRITDADQRDPTGAERKYLADRIAKLAFAIEHGEPWVTTVMRRHIRLARLKLDADPELLAGVRNRLVLSSRSLDQQPEPEPAPAEKTHPTMPPQPVEPVHVPAPEPTPAVEPERIKDRLTVQGVHMSPDGALLRGAVLERDAVGRMTRLLKIAAGTTNADLAALYDPPLKERKAQEFGAKARAALTLPTNGYRHDELVP